MQKSVLYIIAASVLVAAAILIPRLLHPNQSERPAHQLGRTTAVFEKTILDLGDVEQFSPIYGNYTLRNTGVNGLLIENILTNCYCTTSSFKKGVIKAKDSTVVTIRYDSTRLGTFQSTGIVTSNGFTEPVLLILRGNVTARR